MLLRVSPRTSTLRLPLTDRSSWMSTKPPSGNAPVWTPFFRRFVNERSVDLQATMQLHSEVRSLWQASMWSHSHAVQAAANLVFTRLQRRVPIPEEFEEPVKNVARSIVQEQHHLFTCPTAKDIKELSLKQQVELREYLRK